MTEVGNIHNTMDRKILLWSFYALIFFLPVSYEYAFIEDKLQLFFPTEPILMFISLVLPFYSIRKFKNLKRISRFELIIVALFVATGIAALLSTDMKVSIKYLITILWFCTGGFLVPRVIRMRKNEWSFALNLYIASCSLLAIYLFYRFMVLGGISYENSYRIGYPFFGHGHTNISVVFEPALFMSLFLLLKGKRTKYKDSLYILSALLFYAVIKFSWSRASFITTLAYIPIILFLIKKQEGVIIKKALLLVVLLPVGLHEVHDFYHENYRRDKISYNIDDPLTHKANRMYKLLLEPSVSNQERTNRWKEGMVMLKEAPIVGIGPGYFAERYEQKRVNNELQETTSISHFYMNIHNLYLGLLTEGGLLVGILALSIFLSIILSIIIWFFKGLGGKFRITATEVLLTAYFSSFFIHGLVQDFWNEPRVIIPFWIAVYLFSRSKKALLSP